MGTCHWRSQEWSRGRCPQSASILCLKFFPSKEFNTFMFRAHPQTKIQATPMVPVRVVHEYL